jgi:hypothetical protein
MEESIADNYLMCKFRMYRYADFKSADHFIYYLSFLLCFLHLHIRNLHIQTLICYVQRYIKTFTL